MATRPPLPDDPDFPPGEAGDVPPLPDEPGRPPPPDPVSA